MKPRVVVFGYSNVGHACLKLLLDKGANVVGVYTHADNPNESRWFPSVAELARKSGVETRLDADLSDPAELERLKALAPELILSFYYRSLLPAAALETARLGAFNMHGSLLPKYRGRAPVNWAVLHGETETGPTLHVMTARADAGDIVEQEAVRIGPDDTAAEVQARVTEAAVRVLGRQLDALLAGKAPRRAQDASSATKFGRRTPEDGRIDWSRPAKNIHDLVRAVTHPYPGAFTDLFGGKTYIWKTKLALTPTLIQSQPPPSTARPVGEPTGLPPSRKQERELLKSASPSMGGGEDLGEGGRIRLIDGKVFVACGDGRLLEIVRAQREGEEEMDANGFARKVNGGADAPTGKALKVLILGVNGFIGHSLTERILTTTDWEVYGLDMAFDKIEPFLGHKRFHFLEGDISINKEWIEYHVKKCDVILPLVAIATPAAYVKRPLAVFDLDFEQNLRIVKQCVEYKKRVVFPSTSEVYGMCPDAEFDEESSPLVYGPIHKQRWIYSCSKQLLDRVIYAYGQSEGLRFTLFRPFNWIGPNLDSIDSSKEGSSRVLTQFLHNILMGEPIRLVDGGRQRRSFTYISDGIDALMKIIENRGGRADGGIFNIGNPANDLSIAELAAKLIDGVAAYPGYEARARATEVLKVSSAEYYGSGYQDIETRLPSIRRAKEKLGWEPRVSMDEAIRLTLDFYLRKGSPVAVA